MTDQEVQNFMNEAILEGRKALPQCLPNPPVGCVIVYKGEIIARGYTNEPGNNHAEAMALECIQHENPKDLSMFVTLEPCAFKGRTPSCAKAIVTRRIGNVYVGMLDPHPRNRGNGIRILTESNVHVKVGVLKDQVYEELKNYLLHEDERIT